MNVNLNAKIADVSVVGLKGLIPLYEAGNPDAINLLAEWMGYGLECSLDPSFCASCFEKAARMGNTQAMLSLGICYMRGNGVTVDFYAAERWIRAALECKDPDAERVCGSLYESTIGWHKPSIREYCCALFPDASEDEINSYVKKYVFAAVKDANNSSEGGPKSYNDITENDVAAYEASMDNTAFSTMQNDPLFSDNDKQQYSDYLKSIIESCDEDDIPYLCRLLYALFNGEPDLTPNKLFNIYSRFEVSSQLCDPLTWVERASFDFTPLMARSFSDISEIVDLLDLRLFHFEEQNIKILASPILTKEYLRCNADQLSAIKKSLLGYDNSRHNTTSFIELLDRRLEEIKNDYLMNLNTRISDCSEDDIFTYCSVLYSLCDSKDSKSLSGITRLSSYVRPELSSSALQDALKHNADIESLVRIVKPFLSSYDNLDYTVSLLESRRIHCVQSRIENYLQSSDFKTLSLDELNELRKNLLSYESQGVAVAVFTKIVDSRVEDVKKARRQEICTIFQSADFASLSRKQLYELKQEISREANLFPDSNQMLEMADAAILLFDGEESAIKNINTPLVSEIESIFKTGINDSIADALFGILEDDSYSYSPSTLAEWSKKPKIEKYCDGDDDFLVFAYVEVSYGFGLYLTNKRIFVNSRDNKSPKNFIEGYDIYYFREIRRSGISSIIISCDDDNAKIKIERIDNKKGFVDAFTKAVTILENAKVKVDSIKETYSAKRLQLTGLHIQDNHRKVSPVVADIHTKSDSSVKHSTTPVSDLNTNFQADTLDKPAVQAASQDKQAVSTKTVQQLSVLDVSQLQIISNQLGLSHLLDFENVDIQTFLNSNQGYEKSGQKVIIGEYGVVLIKNLPEPLLLTNTSYYCAQSSFGKSKLYHSHPSISSIPFTEYKVAYSIVHKSYVLKYDFRKTVDGVTPHFEGEIPSNYDKSTLERILQFLLYACYGIFPSLIDAPSDIAVASNVTENTDDAVPHQEKDGVPVRTVQKISVPDSYSDIYIADSKKSLSVGSSTSKIEVVSALSLRQLESVFIRKNNPQFSVKLQKAVKHYAKINPSEIPIFLFDSTLFGSAKEGFIITDKNLYCNFSILGIKDYHVFPLEKIVAVCCTTKDNKFFQIFVTDGSQNTSIYYTHDSSLANLAGATLSTIIAILS